MTANKPELYRDLSRQLSALLAGERDLIANAANTAALIYHGLPDLNWAGFYFSAGAELVLGPFQESPPVYGSRSARAFAAPPPNAPRQYWSLTSTIFPATSPATRTLARNSSCRWWTLAGYRACSTSTARFSVASTRSIGKVASS